MFRPLKFSCGCLIPPRREQIAPKNTREETMARNPNASKVCGMNMGSRMVTILAISRTGTEKRRRMRSGCSSDAACKMAAINVALPNPADMSHLADSGNALTSDTIAFVQGRCSDDGADDDSESERYSIQTRRPEAPTMINPTSGTCKAPHRRPKLILRLRACVFLGRP
jgi:hypothetical protein